jgi:hypothetical protein
MLRVGFWHKADFEWPVAAGELSSHWAGVETFLAHAISGGS